MSSVTSKANFVIPDDRYATLSDITTAISNLISTAPSNLDTLNELAAALGDDANFATNVTNSIAAKLPLSGGTMSGNLVLKSISGTDQLVENTYGAYLHLGDWGVGRTANTAVLVNTAYRADYADSLFDMNISRFTNDSGYLTSVPAQSWSSITGKPNLLELAYSAGSAWSGNTGGSGRNLVASYHGSSGNSVISFGSANGDLNLSVDGNIYVQEGQQKVATESFVTSRGYLTTSGKAADSELLDGLDSSRFLYTTTGQFSGDWNTLTDGNQEIRLVEVHNITSGAHSNYPTGIYTYGSVLGWQLDNSTFKLYNSHTGDLAFQTGWNNDNYSGWRTIIHSANIASQSVNYATTAGALTSMNISQFTNNSGYITSNNATGSNGNFYIDDNFGYGIVGVYSATRYQGIWAMGDSYKLPGDGTSPGSLYGLAWTYNPDYGGAGNNAQAKPGLNHQLLLMMNGRTYTAIGSGIWTDGTITTTSHGNSSQWNTAYGWGNHASAGYAASSHNHDGVYATAAQGAKADTALQSLPAHNHDGVYLAAGGKAADSNLLDGLDLHTGRNNEANKVVRTDANGYIQAGWINTPSGATTSTLTKIYASQDDYIRYVTPAEFRRQITDGVYQPAGSYAASSHTHDISNVTGLQEALDGKQAAGSYAASNHNHTYDVNSVWLRENGDNANVKLYGNTRQMAFRTDGTTEYAAGVGGYPFVWMYGGDAASNRRMLMDTSGNLWTDTYGWLHDYFQRAGSYAAASHTHAISEVTGLQSALDGKQAAGSYAASSHTHTPSQVGLGNVTNAAQVTTSYNSSLNSDSRNSRGVTRLYRRDSDSDYSVQTYWTGARWRLYGYVGDSNHADTHVGYADSAGSASSASSATTASNVDNGNVYTTGNNLYIKNAGVNNYRVHHTGSVGVFDVTSQFSIREMSSIWSATRYEWGNWMSYAWFDVDPWGDNWGIGSRPTSWKTVNRGSFLTFGFEDWSDRRSKSAIVEIDNAVDKVKAIGGYTYWKVGSEVREAGVIAQDVLEVFPEAIGGTEEGYSVKPAALIGLLSKAVKEQQEMIDALTARIEALENK